VVRLIPSIRLHSMAGKLQSFCTRIYTAAGIQISIKSRVKYTKKIR